MQEERDYYAILGVPANAPEADIRRAFRARAKELHPDSKPAGEREQAHREFNSLTEAYDTLKDAERREAYDEELRSSRQLVRVEGKGSSAGAMVMGGILALLLVGGAVGAGFFWGRAERAPKNQESLRVTKVQPLPPAAAPSISAESGQPAAPAAVVSPRPEPAPVPPDTRGSVEQAKDAAKETRPAETAARPSADAEDGGYTTPVPDRPVRAPRSQFAGEVLSLESQTRTDPGGAAVYRLISLVNSSVAIEDLSEAASLASRPETIELLKGRIVALQEHARETASGAKQEPAVEPSVPETAAAARQDGTYDIATGARPGETILRLRPGNGLKESFSDCAFCPEMVTVPGGQTVIGSRPESSGYRPEEGPAHKVTIQKPFAVSKHGISAENWRVCVDAGICRPTLASYLASGPGIPETRVSWFDAKTYAEWLSKTTGRRYRLLSEVEWEYAAQAGKLTDATKADGQASGHGGLVRLGGGGLKQLGETKPNGWGVYPLPGNLMEWVEDCWHANYAQAPQDGSAWLSGSSGDCAYRVVRGVASAGGEFGGRRLAGRARESADARSPTLGFRIARDLNALSKTALDASGMAGGRTARGD